MKSLFRLKVEVHIMIYVTGDFHGNVRELLSRFDRLQPGEGDIIVVLGDAGLN